MHATCVCLVLVLFYATSKIEAKHKNLADEENAFTFNADKKLIHSLEVKEMGENDLKEKLNKAEKALEESINRLVKVGVEAFMEDKLLFTKSDEESRHGRITMKEKKKNEYCHAKVLVYCGKRTELSFLEAEIDGKLDFSSQCQIKEHFLDCMTLMKSKACKNLPDIDLTEEEFNQFRARLMNRLKEATGCTLPIQH